MIGSDLGKDLLLGNAFLFTLFKYNLSDIK